jgi:RND family efflux transporter MFP subunit
MTADTQSEHEAQNVAAAPAAESGRRDGILQVVLVVGVLIAGLIANVVLSRGASEPQIRVTGTDAVVVDVVQPDIRDTPIRIVETGTLQVRNDINLSPQVSGRVVAVSPNLASGGYFRAGEVLFRLDDADYRSALNRAQAEVSAARADLRVERAEAEVARREWSMVYPGEEVPPLVAREPQISRAEAAVQAAESALADARLGLSRVEFSLPFDGRILATTIKVGQNLAAGQSYGRAYEIDDIEVSVPVHAAALEGLSPAVGHQAVVRPNTRTQLGARSYSAKLMRADAELDPQTRLARLTLAFTEPVPLLPGEFVEVEISGPVVPNAHLIPERSVSENRTVWVVESGRLAAREPRLIYAQDGILVAAPFDTADGIVVSTLMDPVEGALVEIARRPGRDGDGHGDKP